MYLPRVLMNSLQTSGNGQGCISLHILLIYIYPVGQKEIDNDLFTRWYKYASFGLTIFGAFLMAKRAIQYIMERKRRWVLQKRYIS